MRNRRTLCAGVVTTLLAASGVLAVLVGTPGDESESIADSTRITARIAHRIELGRRLYFEPQLSNSGERSCASCHAPDHGFSDPDRVSLDDIGTTRRHSQTIVDSRYNPTAHWDGEFSGVEELVTRRLGSQTSVWRRRGTTTPRPSPITPRIAPVRVAVRRTPTRLQAETQTGPVSHKFLDEYPLARGFGGRAVTALQAENRYGEAFQAAFGSKDISIERIALAVAAYCYSVESTEAPFDRYKAGDKKAISRSAKRGMLLFIGRAGCAECHKMEGSRPLFTDYAFHNSGVTYEAVYEGRKDLVKAGLNEEVLRAEDTPPHGKASILDRGRARLTGTAEYERTFKTPTLRDVALRAPYMHNGSLDSLEDVVRWYADGCGTDPEKHPTLQRFRCSEQDVTDLVAFLETLTGDERPGLAKKAWKKRAKRTRVTLLTGDTPLADVDVKLVPVGDPIPTRTKKGEDPDGSITLRTNSRGEIAYTPKARTHMRIVLPDNLPTINSALVPDTCRQTTIYTAIKGQMRIVVTIPSEWPAPPMIVAEHPSSARATTTGKAPRTIFHRTGVVDTKYGKVARYSAWVRSDAPPSVVLRMPGLTRSRRGRHVGAVNLQMEPGVTRRIDLTAN